MRTVVVQNQMNVEQLKLLKGKSCFPVKQLTPELKKDISDALKISYEGYRKPGWAY